MFLRPHHFQAAERHALRLAQLSEKWDLHHNWGLRGIDLDLEALANYRLVVRALKARLRDGTLVSVPEEGTLPALDLKPAFERGGPLTVYLGLPVFNLNRPNVSADSVAEGGRYRPAVVELEDENTGINPQAVQVRLPNLNLLLSTQDLSGYDVLPIARLEKSPRAEATPQLDESYIPPVLACDAWPVLRAAILQAVYDRIGKKVGLLSTQVVSRGISLEGPAAGDALILGQLRELNEAYALLGILAFADGLHPLQAYLELCRLVGQLSIFSATRRPPELPKYDHDDLGGCFYQVKQHLDALLDIVVEPAYKERPFVGAGLRMQVSLEPSWLELGWQMLVGVQSPLPAEECVRLLTKAGQLDLKIGSSDRVDDIYRLGEPGLKFSYTPHPPRALPTMPGLVYLQVDRGSQQEEWQNVQKSLTLAIRLNENRIAGSIQGQRILKLKTAGQTATLQFTLYVLPP
jgi:type VI secretion system protein ImpJ